MGTAEEERGSRDRRTQPVFFGEAAESEFQEPITLVETSFLWPGRVTWLGGDQRQAGPQVWASSRPGSCCHPLLSLEAEGAGRGLGRKAGICGPPQHTGARPKAGVLSPAPRALACPLPSPSCGCFSP